MKELEAALLAEKERAQSLESDVKKLIQVEETLLKANEEIEKLKNELQETRTKQVALEGSSSTTTGKKFRKTLFM